MGGKMDAAWWRDYRARNRERLNANLRRRRAVNGRVRGDRSEEYRRHQERTRVAPPEPLPMLYPDLQHGSAMSFWEDELRMDLAQERELAILEGRSPEEAVKEYRVREYTWHRICADLPEER